MNEFRTRTFVCSHGEAAIDAARTLLLEQKNFRVEMIEAGWKFIVQEQRT